MSSIGSSSSTNSLDLDDYTLKVGLLTESSGKIEKGKILTLSDGSYRFVSSEGEKNIDGDHKLVVLFNRTTQGSQQSSRISSSSSGVSSLSGSSGASQRRSYEPASIVVEDGQSYISFGRDQDSQVKRPLKDFAFTLTDKVKSGLKRRAKHLSAAVVLPCAGTALLVEAVAKTALIPLRKPLGLSKEHFSARAVGHDYAFGALFIAKGVRQTVQVAADCFGFNRKDYKTKHSITEKVLTPAKKLLQQNHHHPHMQIVPATEIFVKGLKEMGRKSSGGGG